MSRAGTEDCDETGIVSVGGDGGAEVTGTADSEEGGIAIEGVPWNDSERSVATRGFVGGTPK